MITTKLDGLTIHITKARQRSDARRAVAATRKADVVRKAETRGLTESITRQEQSTHETGIWVVDRRFGVAR